MADITATTGKEVALVRKKDGTTVLIIGSENNVRVPRNGTVVAHTHPNGALVLSRTDVIQLMRNKQASTFLIGPDGSMVYWTLPKGKAWTDVIKGPTVLQSIIQ